MNSNKETVHRKQLQNANQIITVDVKRKPKVVTKPKVICTFKRNCLLKNEIDKIKKKELKPKTVINLQKARKSPQENSNRNNKINRKVRHKSDISWMEFMGSNNILTQDKISGVQLVTDRLDGGLSSAGSINRQRMPIPKHLSMAMKQKDISLQCDLSKDLPTMPVRYLNAIPSRQKEQPDKLIYNKVNAYQNKPSIGIEHAQPQQKECLEDETHTPFGESALRLIHQLRDHLRSRGDSESSDLVNQIEAYIGGGSGKTLNDGNEVFKFPSASRYNTPKENLDVMKTSYQTIIDNQNLRIEQLEKTNEELRVLSAKLLEYHQKAEKYAPSQNRHAIDEVPVKLPKNAVVVSDSEETESKEALKLERDALLRKVQSQKDLIFNLEVKLHKIETDSVRPTSDANSVSNRSAPSAVVSGFDANRHFDKYPIWKHPEVRLDLAKKQASSRSDTDSAFEDRSVSQSNSKRSSPSNRDAIFKRPLPPDEVPTDVRRQEAVVIVAKENLSLTRHSEYTDDDIANAQLDKVYSDQTNESVKSSLIVRTTGKVMESTRISSDDYISPKTTWLSEVDLSGDEYRFLLPELTTT